MLRLPSGPPPLPLVGNLLDIGMGKGIGLGPQPHVRMTTLAEQYGDVMALRMGGAEPEPWVVLSSPAAVHDAFVARGGDFSGRPMVSSMAVSSGGGQGFAQPTMTKRLRELRGLAFSTLFGAAAVEQAEMKLEAESQRLAQHLLRLQATSGAPELRPALRRCVTNMVCTYVFSSRVAYETEDEEEHSTAEQEEVHRLTRELAEVVDETWTTLTATSTTAADLLVPAAQPTARALINAPLSALVDRRNGLLRALIAKRREARQRRAAASRPSAAPTPDMLDALLDAQMSEAEVLYTLVDLFVAGVNTVSTALEWTLLLSANDQQSQSRARAAARRGSPPSRTGGMAEAGIRAAEDASAHYAPSVTSVRSPHVQALISETLRCKPPLLLPRRAVRDSAICGFDIKAGTLVLANNHALTQSTRWWRDPALFRPSRFLEEEAGLRLRPPGTTARAGLGDVDACKFIPFSIGARVCPGARLAEAQLYAATRVLLSSVRWARDGGTPIDLSEEYSLTLRPMASQRLRFSELS